MNKIAIDRDIDTTNIIKDKEMLKIKNRAHDIIDDVLSNHSGPYSKYAVEYDCMSSPIFSVDGIGIVASIQFFNPVQMFVKDIVTLVGKNIDLTSGDGTTSAMIIANAALRYITSEFLRQKISYPNAILQQTFKHLIEAIRNEYQNHVITKEWLMTSGFTWEDAIKIIAKHQSYSSSHGDMDIVNTIIEFFCTVPEEQWRYIVKKSPLYEDSRRIWLESNSNQYSCSAQPLFIKSMLDYNSTGRKCDHADLVMIHTPFTPNVTAGKKIINLIGNHQPDHRHLLILMPADMDSTSRALLIEVLNSDRRYERITVMVIPSMFPQYNAITNLIHLVGQNTYKVAAHENVVFLEDVSFDFNDRELTLNRLYDEQDLGKNEPYNPYYKNIEQFPAFKTYLNDLDDRIEREVNSTTSNAEAVNALYELRNSLILRNRKTIFLGGTSYDNLASGLVLTDTIKAVSSSLRNGMADGANRSLYAVLGEVTPPAECAYPELFKIYVKAFQYAIHKMHQALLKNVPKKIKRNINPMDNFDLIARTSGNFWDPGYYGASNRFMIVQPGSADLTLMERFMDGALRTVNISELIISSGVYTGEAKKQPWYKKLFNLFKFKKG